MSFNYLIQQNYRETFSTEYKAVGVMGNRTCGKAFNIRVLDASNRYQISGMHAHNGVLFNHESPRSGETFLTRKVTRGVPNTPLGLESGPGPAGEVALFPKVYTK